MDMLPAGTPQTEVWGWTGSPFRGIKSIYIEKRDLSHVNNLVHCVWATKRHYPFLTGTNKSGILHHLMEYADNNGIGIDFINGYKDHIHCLLSLHPDQALSSVIQRLKGESSRWIRTNLPGCQGFRWAHEYYAISVSPSIINKVRDYIRNQEIHHIQRSAENELQLFLNTIDNYSKKFRWDLIHD